MKTFRLLLLLIAVSAGIFYACSDSGAIENHVTTQKSIALRTALNEIKKANPTGRSASANPLCFDFVYPITLSLSNGTNVTVSSYAGLLDLVANESTNLYVDGIAYPLNVAIDGAIDSISDEQEFVDLLIHCGFATWNNYLQTTYCYDITFPISVTTSAGTVQIASSEAFTAYLNALQETEAQLIFPLQVIYGGQVVTLNNIFDFFQMIDNCDTCICTQEWAPVCVQTPAGVVQYGNMCYATCAGYTQNDIVNCNPTSACNITNLTVSTGICSATGYVLSLNFTYANAGSTTFEVHNTNGALVGTFPLSSLPLTITNYLFTGQSSDHLTINISGNTGCSAVQQYTAPNCNVTCESSCPTTVDPVCVQTATGLVQYTNACLALCAGHTQAEFITCGVAPTNFGTALGSCFNLAYPVQIQSGGQVITANDNGTVLQYWFPATAAIPAFVYPVTVTVGNTTQTITSEQGIQAILNNCN